MFYLVLIKSALVVNAHTCPTPALHDDDVAPDRLCSLQGRLQEPACAKPCHPGNVVQETPA